MMAEEKAALPSPQVLNSSTLPHVKDVIFSICIQKLPDEMLLKIFSHLTEKDLCLGVAQVCRRWNLLCRDKSIWRNRSLYVKERDDEYEMTTILQTCSALHSLMIHGRTDVYSLISVLTNHCEELQKLHLNFCKLGSNETSFICKIVSHFPTLTSLHLVGTQLHDPESFYGLYQLSSLTSLDLTHSKSLSGKWLRLIVNGCRELRDLRLDDIVHLRDGDVAYIAEKCGEKLEILTLDGEDLSDQALIHVSQCKKLKVFEMAFCDHMTDKGLLKGLANLNELTSLKLRRGYEFTSKGLASFLNREALSCMVSLDLSECSALSDRGIFNLSRRCPNLKFLKIQWCCDVTDIGLLDVVTYCSQLVKLDLLGIFEITGVEAFPLLPARLPKLLMLNLEQCNNVNDDALFQLTKDMPSLKVINYYGDIF